jgi:hypothetical protein
VQGLAFQISHRHIVQPLLRATRLWRFLSSIPCHGYPGAIRSSTAVRRAPSDVLLHCAGSVAGASCVLHWYDHPPPLPPEEELWREQVCNFLEGPLNRNVIEVQPSLFGVSLISLAVQIQSMPWSSMAIIRFRVDWCGLCVQVRQSRIIGRRRVSEGAG